jgi:hypothetical protein
MEGGVDMVSAILQNICLHMLANRLTGKYAKFLPHSF